MHHTIAFHRLFPLTLILATPLAVVAQPQLKPGATELTVVYSHVVESDLENAGPAGSASADQVRVTTRTGLPGAGEAWSFEAGVNLDWFWFDASGGALVPDELRSNALQFVTGYQLDERWSFTVLVAPGTYNDGESFSDGFTVPGYFLAKYALTPGVQLSAGLAWVPFADEVAMPIAGLRWQIDEKWILNLGLPRAGVEYAFNRSTSVFAGASISGGAYEVSGRSLPAALRGSKVEYRQIRVGAGAGFALNETWSLDAEFGVVAEQSWDYHKRGLEVESDEAPFYGRLALTAGF